MRGLLERGTSKYFFKEGGALMGGMMDHSPALGSLHLQIYKVPVVAWVVPRHANPGRKWVRLARWSLGRREEGGGPDESPSKQVTPTVAGGRAHVEKGAK